MRKKNLKPVITGSVLIIPVILLGAGIGANAKSPLPKINTGSSGIKINQMKLPRMTPSTGGLKTIATKIMKNPFKTSGSNVNNSNPNKFPIDRCNSIQASPNFKNNSNKGSITSSNDPDFNPGTGPVYENVLTVNTSSGNKGTKPTLSPKNRPLPPIPGSNESSGGGSGKRPAYNPNKGKAPEPPSNVEPYRPGSTNNKNKLTLKQNNNGKQEPIYDEVPNDPIYEEIPGGNEPIYMNTGSFGDSIYDIPN